MKVKTESEVAQSCPTVIVKCVIFSLTRETAQKSRAKNRVLNYLFKKYLNTSVTLYEQQHLHEQGTKTWHSKSEDVELWCGISF